MSPELDAALRALEALAGRPGGTTRHTARPILLALGDSLLSGRAEEAGEVVRRLRALPPALREAWSRAVRDEISMAAAEHVRSVDPRYLSHPAYDLEYTLGARRRLEARLRAAEGLGEPIDPTERAGIGRADALLGKRFPGIGADWRMEGRRRGPQ